jgi:hypothetical protein
VLTTTGWYSTQLIPLTHSQLITFLVAGHETTSGMLSFTVYYLLRHPQAMQKLRNEIDEVCGDEDITLNHLAKMPYLLGSSFAMSFRLLINFLYYSCHA